MCPHWDGTTLEREITDHMRLNAANTYHTTAQNFTTLPNTSKKSCYQAAPKCTDCQEYYAPRMSQWCSVLHSSPFISSWGRRKDRTKMDENGESLCRPCSTTLRQRRKHIWRKHIVPSWNRPPAKHLFVGIVSAGVRKGFLRPNGMYKILSWELRLLPSASGTLGASGQAVDRLKLLPCKTK